MHAQCAKSLEAITGQTPEQSLVLQLLAKTTPDLAPTLGAMMADCASVCFDSQGHISGHGMAVVGKKSGSRFKVFWGPVTEKMRRSYRLDSLVTDQGASGVAILLMQRITKYKVIEQSVRGDGFDYWLGDKGALPFAKKARLEISGIRQGTEADVKARRAEKMIQTRRTDSTRLKAFIVIVEFSRPLSHVTIRTVSRKKAPVAT